jgi:hypothetical protein
MERNTKSVRESAIVECKRQYCRERVEKSMKERKNAREERERFNREWETRKQEISFERKRLAEEDRERVRQMLSRFQLE